MSGLSELAQTIIKDVKDGEITVEEIQEGLENGELTPLEDQVKEALAVLKPQTQQ